MLTKELVRARVQRGTIEPSLVDPGKPALVEAADALVEACREAAEGRWTRAQLASVLEDLALSFSSQKIARGLAKLATDRMEVGTEAPLDPTELRMEVFLAARQVGPLGLVAGPFDRPVAADVLAAVGARHDMSADDVGRVLYADRREEQIVQSCRLPSGQWLVHRYNVALVQALLLHCSEVRVVLEAPSAPRMRQLFRYVKFHQLVHAAHRRGKRLELVLDGPTSLFRQSTRYGVLLANFFPALLLQECPWKLRATVLWTKARHRKQLEIGSDRGLQSHYPDTGAYSTPEQEHFAQRFKALDTPWKLSDGRVPLSLGGRDVVFPDFTFRHGRKRAHLEILGYWRRSTVERRLALTAEHGPKNLVLAVSKRLLGDQGAAELPEQVVPFAGVIPARKVLAAVERVGC